MANRDVMRRDGCDLLRLDPPKVDQQDIGAEQAEPSIALERRCARVLPGQLDLLPGGAHVPVNEDAEFVRTLLNRPAERISHMRTTYQREGGAQATGAGAV